MIVRGRSIWVFRATRDLRRFRSSTKTYRTMNILKVLRWTKVRWTRLHFSNVCRLFVFASQGICKRHNLTLSCSRRNTLNSTHLRLTKAWIICWPLAHIHSTQVSQEENIVKQLQMICNKLTTHYRWHFVRSACFLCAHNTWTLKLMQILGFLIGSDKNMKWKTVI